MSDPVLPGVTRTVVGDLRIPPLTVDRVEVRRITIAPGQATGVHRHNGPVFGVIESGTAIVRIDGGDERRLGPGDVFHEPEETRIDRFDAADEELVFLAFFPIGGGVDPALIPLS